uniref:VCBS repeat-containing protein n=1 Tax=Oscillatoriales cyanobacterium SpSt-402 TaxID=2282168 RepID=A0A832M4S9_9CYAN
MKKQFLTQMGLPLVAVIFLGSVTAQGLKAIAEAEPIWYNCLTREVFTPEKQAWCDRWKILQNGTYLVPSSLDLNPQYIKVTLKNGRYQQEDGKFFVELVNQKGWMTLGDLNNDGKKDAAVIFGVALDPNGKSVATYLTAMLDVDSKPRALIPVRLGERIILNGPIMLNQAGAITVPFLTSKEVINRVYVMHEALKENILKQQP